MTDEQLDALRYALEVLEWSSDGPYEQVSNKLMRAREVVREIIEREEAQRF